MNVYLFNLEFAVGHCFALLCHRYFNIFFLSDRFCWYLMHLYYVLQGQTLASMYQALVFPNSKEEGLVPQVHPNWGLSIIHITVVTLQSHHHTNHSLLHKHSHNILGDLRAQHQLQHLQDPLKWVNRVHHICRVNHQCSKVCMSILRDVLYVQTNHTLRQDTFVLQNVLWACCFFLCHHLVHADHLTVGFPCLLNHGILQAANVLLNMAELECKIAELLEWKC